LLIVGKKKRRKRGGEKREKGRRAIPRPSRQLRKRVTERKRGGEKGKRKSPVSHILFWESPVGEGFEKKEVKGEKKKRRRRKRIEPVNNSRRRLNGKGSREGGKGGERKGRGGRETSSLLNPIPTEGGKGKRGRGESGGGGNAVPLNYGDWVRVEEGT